MVSAKFRTESISFTVKKNFRMFAAHSSMQHSMNSLWDIPFIVVDVETTGADAKKNRVMEIACMVVRGGEIVERFSSLINPHQFIPPFIAKMTGIDNAMVFNAPEAKEVMPRVRDLLTLPHAVFVAHHVQFDWQFVCETFKRTDIHIPEIAQLCSYKLARRILPQKVKKNVGDVAKYFDITIENRHRAEGDAEATALFTIEFLRQLNEDFDIETVEDLLQFQNKQLAYVRNTPAFIKRVAVYLEQLPEEPGIYKMIDAQGDILYVGKAKSLRDRVRSYFQTGAQHTEKIAKMVTLVHRIEWECTATELSALLLESKEIKRLKPPFNTASKSLRRFPFLRLTVQEQFPRLEWSSSINDDGAEYYGPFRNRTMTREIADTIQQDFTLRLCRDELQPSADFSPCFYYHIKRCHAPCAALQSPEDYQKEVQRVRSFLGGFSDGVIDKLTAEMNKAAEQLDFETAIILRNRITELQRLFLRKEQVSTSVNANNVIIIVPVSEREKTLEIFAIKRGRLAHQQIIGRKSPLRHLTNRFPQWYYDNQDSEELTPHEIDEIQIITSWMHRNRNNGMYIYVEGKSLEELIAHFTHTVRHAFIPANDHDSPMEV